MILISFWDIGVTRGGVARPTPLRIEPKLLIRTSHAKSKLSRQMKAISQSISNVKSVTIYYAGSVMGLTSINSNSFFDLKLIIHPHRQNLIYFVGENLIFPLSYRICLG